MAPPSKVWPNLASRRENSAPPQERVLNAHHDAAVLLEFLETHKDVKVPSSFVEFTRIMKDLSKDLLQNPLGQEWRQVIKDLQGAIVNIQTNLKAIRTANPITSTASHTARIRTYAEMTRKAPPPSHHVSSHGSGSSLGASPVELQQDREVIVKLGDKEGVNCFRRYANIQIVQ
ncbi:hypothetical protein BDW74DRAFT_181761 [Aspergillus multicolor]|uniref:uncharacterized protein n=1 Tax=Aspergillus multicolor TaxID=41759 RepID=UPI003CCCCEDA